MANRRRTRTLPKEKAPFVRREQVLAMLRREHDAAIERGDRAELLVRAECRGEARALMRVATTVGRMRGVGERWVAGRSK